MSIQPFISIHIHPYPPIHPYSTIHVLSIHPSVCLSGSLSIHPSFNPSINPSIQTSVCLYVCYLNHLLIFQLSICPFTLQCVCLLECLSVCITIDQPIRQSINQ